VGCLYGLFRLGIAMLAGFVAFWVFLFGVFASVDGFVLRLMGSAIGAGVVSAFVGGALKDLRPRRLPNPIERCLRCQGAGTVRVPAVDTKGRPSGTVEIVCATCGGSGRRPIVTVNLPDDVEPAA
jgi:hypothetical protein